MTFLEKLKASCKKCKPNTIRTYMQNVARLYKLNNEGDIPTTGAWLSVPKLQEKFKKLPLSQRRHLSLAGLKSEMAYKIADKKRVWYEIMKANQKEYMDHRNTNTKSENEKQNMLKHGIKDLKKITSEYRRRIRRVITGAPTLSGLYKYQLYISIKLFTQVPFRNTFASMQIKEVKTGNYMRIPKRGNIEFVMREYKNSDKLGPRSVTLTRGVTTALKKFLTYRSSLVDHNFMLSNKQGKPISKAAFGKAIRKLMKDMTGKNIGSRLIRVMHATDNKEIIEKAAALTNKLLHSSKQTAQYVRKD